MADFSKLSDEDLQKLLNGEPIEEPEEESTAGAPLTSPEPDGLSAAQKAALTLGAASAGAAVPYAEKGIRSFMSSLMRPLANSMTDRMGLSNPDVAAESKILKAFARDKMSPDTALQEYLNQQRRKPLTVADLGGESMRRLGRAVAVVPGQSSDVASRQFLQRQLGQHERMADDLYDLAANQRDFRPTLRKMIEDRESSARGNYEKAFDYGGFLTPDIERILSTPTGQRAAEIARDMVPDLVGANPERWGDLKDSFIMNPASGITKSRANMIAMDVMKKAIDQAWLEKTQPNPLTSEPKNTPWSFSKDEVRKGFRDALVAMNPAYGDALKEFSSDIESEDAFNYGHQKFSAASPEELADALADMSASERYLFKAGAVRNLAEKMQNKSARLNKTEIFGSPGMQQKLAMIIEDPKDLAEFQKRLDLEGRMVATKNRVLGGSDSIPKSQDLDELDDSGVQLVRDLVQYGPIKTGLKRTWDRAKGTREAVADRIGSRIFDPEKTEQVLKDLVQRAQKIQQQKRSASVRRNIVAGALGAAGAGAGLYLSNRNWDDEEP